MMVVPRRSPDRCPWRSPLLVRTALGHCCARTRYFRTVPASSSCVWFATTFLFRGRCYPADTPASARFASANWTAVRCAALQSPAISAYDRRSTYHRMRSSPRCGGGKWKDTQLKGNPLICF
uniref:(northern house mosquito) hypothetical protein n=2 Tax=Culex pipiens TaxID=7175 RepID=A0A8D8DWB8_CULPI